MHSIGIKAPSDSERGLIGVIFLIRTPPFNAGEEAGVEPKVAEQLVANGAARYTTPPETKPAAAPAPDPQSESETSAAPLAEVATEGPVVEPVPPATPAPPASAQPPSTEAAAVAVPVVGPEPQRPPKRGRR